MWDCVTFRCDSEPHHRYRQTPNVASHRPGELRSRSPRLLIYKDPIAVMAFLHHLSHPHDFQRLAEESPAADDQLLLQWLCQTKIRRKDAR